MNIQKPRLFTTDTLVVQGTRNAMRSEHSTSDNNGTQIAQITQAGSLGRRTLGTDTRHDIFDVNEDSREDDKLLIITDPSNVFDDTYKVPAPNGAQIATAKTKRFSLKLRLTLSAKGFSDVDVDGGFRGKNYTLTSKGRLIVETDRKYRGLKGAITGKDTYALYLELDLSEETWAAVIGTALVIDTVRCKNDETAVVSVS